MAMGLQTAQLEAFEEVAKLRNFSKAAKALHITQSALSQRIINLESELEVALFIRDPSGLRLTDVMLF
jgi:DNA-binding transcriptional LysR family regulator